MTIEDRWYQEESSQALVDCIKDDNSVHPLVVAPTASGKTMIICKFIDKLITKKPDLNILILSHVQSILEQDHAAIKRYFDYDAGLYSSGLDSRTIKKITVAGIQSVWRKAKEFSHFDIVIIDEAHLIPVDGEGMYRSFLEAIKVTYVGVTATHFRLKSGYIHKGEGAIFNKIAYDLSSVENFNRLTDEGYLSKLITKNTALKMDVTGIHKRGGDFKEDELSIRFDKDDITEAAVKEIIQYGKNYSKWLLFAIDIQHAEHIAEYLNKNGIKTIAIHSKMDADAGIKDYKNDVYRCAVNVNILTTGFDEPRIDLIGILRPTDSPVMHVQMIGRGLRPHEDKEHCFIMDFAGNTKRLGPVNDVVIKTGGGKEKGEGEPITKSCPECDCEHHPTTKICDGCGYEFVFKTKLEHTASSASVVKEKAPLQKEWIEVNSVSYSLHQKQGAPDSLRVSYQCGMTSFSEWICIQHSGFPKRKADHWVQFRWKGKRELIPQTVHALLKCADEMLQKPFAIYVDNTGQFPRVEDCRFDFQKQ